MDSLHEVFEWLAGFIVAYIEETEYIGIFILMVLEGSFVPIPSEIILPFSGYLVSQGELSLWLVALVGALGNIVGTMFTYTLSRYVGYPFFYRYGKYVLVTHDDIELARRLFARFGVAIIFISRLLPGVRGFLPIPAGVARMRIVPFVVYVFIGSFLWSLFLTYLGVILGENWGSLEGYFRQFNWVLLVAGVVFAAWWIRRYIRQVRKF
ncbi:MAG: DedA family protein [Candidatus Spechtbacterales bacterium]